jgi:hypothetical protein
MSWEMSKMTSSALLAEQHIMNNMALGVDITKASKVVEEVEQVKFMYDGFGNARTITPKDKIKEKLDALEIQGNKLLEQEKYELFIELKEIYEKYKQEYDRL